MPCYYTGSAEGDARLAAEETRERLGKEITNRTRLLCSICQTAEEAKLTLPKDVQTWWNKHKKVDKKRKEKERRRQ